MERIVKLIDESINKLKKLVPDEHKMRCNTCGQEMDMRDLSQVVFHEGCYGIPLDKREVKQISYSASQKIGSSELHIKDVGVINLN